MTTELTIKEGNIYGPWRKAINAAAGRGIHDDAIGKSVGMRGGVVAGTVHLDLFPRVCVETFGQRWFEQGNVSLFFTYALLHGEEVRAVVQEPPKGATDVQVEAWLETPEGKRVARGTVSVGNPDEKPYLQTLELESSPREEIRIYKRLEVGWEPPLQDVSDVQDDLSSLENCEDTLEWYSGNSPWESAVVPPSHVARLMMLRSPFQAEGVAFYGASEVGFVNGPAKVGVTYQVKSKVIAVGVTSKTEYFWFDAGLHEKGSQKLVATMRHMTRAMKAGSSLYPEIPPAQ